MKKIIFFWALLLAITVNAQYKSFGLGVNGGIPIGNLEKTHNAAFGFDVNYFYNLTDQIGLGAASGFLFFSAEDGAENRSYIPIAAAVKFNNDEDKWFVQGDFGYAIGITPEGDDGGFYFKPILGYNINESFGLNVFYTGIKKREGQGPTFGYIGLGAMFRI